MTDIFVQYLNICCQMDNLKELLFQQLVNWGIPESDALNYATRLIHVRLAASAPLNGGVGGIRERGESAGAGLR